MVAASSGSRFLTGVDAYVTKWHPGPRPQIRDESRKLIARERGELHGEGRDSTRLGDQLRPIASRRGEHARRDSHRMVRCERAGCCGGHVIDRSAHASTVPAAPDVMTSGPRPGRGAIVGSRSQTPITPTYPKLRFSPVPRSPNVASNELCRTSRFWASSNSRAGAAIPVSTGIWQYLLDPGERSKSGS